MTYAQEYRRYATMLRHVDPNAELVACGHDEAWNIEFLRTNSNVRHLGLMDHYSIHRYWIQGGPELNFSEEQYYALLAEAHATENFVTSTAAHLRDVLGESTHKVGVALDEWGVWHPEARPWGPDHEGHREPVTYEQAGTVRDAIATAIALEGPSSMRRAVTGKSGANCECPACARYDRRRRDVAHAHLLHAATP